jgi:hypothetical protein
MPAYVQKEPTSKDSKLTYAFGDESTKLEVIGEPHLAHRWFLGFSNKSTF